MSHTEKITSTAKKALQVAKTTGIVIVVLLALLGAYVLSSATLRNQTIDHIQGQTVSPK